MGIKNRNTVIQFIFGGMTKIYCRYHLKSSACCLLSISVQLNNIMVMMSFDQRYCSRIFGVAACCYFPKSFLFPGWQSDTSVTHSKRPIHCFINKMNFTENTEILPFCFSSILCWETSSVFFQFYPARQNCPASYFHGYALHEFTFNNKRVHWIKLLEILKRLYR